MEGACRSIPASRREGGTEKKEGGEGLQQMKLYPESKLMVREENREGELQKGGRGYNRSQGGKRNKEEKTKQKMRGRGRNTCRKGRMGDHVSSGEVKRLEEE